MAFWKEIDDKAFGKGFDLLLPRTPSAGSLGVADWHGREAIRENLHCLHRYRFLRHTTTTSSNTGTGGSLKIFRGIIVTMKVDDASKPVVENPVMSHFFYMDEEGPHPVATLDWNGRSRSILTR